MQRHQSIHGSHDDGAFEARWRSQCGKAVEAVCALFQFALSTWRELTTCWRMITSGGAVSSPSCTVSPVSKDCCLREVHLRPNHTCVRRRCRVRHRTQQAEGGEQGVPLMPLSLGIHDSLCEVRNRLRPEGTLFAFLDDVYVSSLHTRTRDGYNLLEEQLLAGAGIQLTGKTRVWNRAARASPEWCGARMASRFWLPVGSPEFVHSFSERRLEDDWSHLEPVTWVPDLQSGRQILLQCAAPNCPTARGRPWVRFWRRKISCQHDIWHHCQCVSASERLPQVARNVVDRLDGVQDAEGCIRELHDVTVELYRQGFVARHASVELELGRPLHQRH